VLASAGVSVNIDFIARVGRWSPEHEDEILAELRAWAYEENGFDHLEVVVDILGGGPGNPVVRMEAYTPRPMVADGFDAPHAENRLRQRITAAGGSEISFITGFTREPDGRRSSYL